MAIHDRNVLNEFNIRRLRLMLFYMVLNGINIDGVMVSPVISSHGKRGGDYLYIDSSIYEERCLRENIRGILGLASMEPNMSGSIIEETEKLEKQYLIDKSKLSWIQDENAACWMWCYIKNKSALTYSSVPEPPENLTFTDAFSGEMQGNSARSMIPGFYNLTGIPDPIMDKKGLVEAVVAFFDHWFAERHIKHAEIDILREHWSAINNQKELYRPFGFINVKDEKEIEWCWNYFKRKVTQLKWGYFTPASAKERYMFLNGLFLTWNAPPEAKKLLLNNLKRAFSQHKFRSTEKNRKLFQSYINPQHSKMLKLLAKEKGMKINETLEQIIERAYFLIKEAEKNGRAH